jgi:hypothetical protein
MPDFSVGDWCFIGFILVVIHGIMQGLSMLRRRKSASKF